MIHTNYCYLTKLFFDEYKDYSVNTVDRKMQELNHQNTNNFNNFTIDFKINQMSIYKVFRKYDTTSLQRY